MRTFCVLFALGASIGSAQTENAVDLRTQSKNVDFSAAPATKPFKAGTVLPSSCSAGEVYFKTNATPGQNWYGCTSTNTWTVQTGAGVPAMGGNAGKVLATDGTAADWRPLGGDVTGAPDAVTVTRLRGRNVSPSTPAGGQVLLWNATAQQWEPNSAGGANYSYAFTSQSTVVIAGAAHGLATANLLVDCYDAATPNARLDPSAVTVHPTTYDVTVQFAAARSGRCVVNGSGGGSTGTSAVASVFGRTGAVSAQAGDYSFGEIAGTVTDSQIASGVSAAKIAAGTVSNTAFGYLAGVTSDLQQQLNSKAAAEHTHATGGDLSGDLGAAAVVRIQGRAVSASAPSEGQALVWSAAASAWQPGTVSGGGGGAGMAGQLGDLSVTRTSPTVLTIGAGCTSSTPCNVRFGNVAYSIAQSCTATLGGASGNAFVYVTSSGVVTIGHNTAVTASAGCVAQAGVTSFPADAIPLFTWSASGSAWDALGGRDYRAFLSAKTLNAGTGIATVESSGRTAIGVDTALVPTYLTATATINFAAIAAGTCASDAVFPAPGAAIGDAVAPGWPAGLEPGLAATMRVSAANTIAVRLCNISGANVDPASATFRATVVRSF